MTREEAIRIIDCYDIGFYDLSGEKIPADKLADAFDMAIEALHFAEHFDLLKEHESLQEVVRCKDCRHWDKKDRYCTDGGGLIIGVTENDFCSRGERREPEKCE